MSFNPFSKEYARHEKREKKTEKHNVKHKALEKSKEKVWVNGKYKYAHITKNKDGGTTTQIKGKEFGKGF